MSTSVRALEDLAERVRPVSLARDQRVGVVAPLDALLPEGLPRGVVVAVGAAPGVAGTTSLALALAAGPSQDGAWVAVVGARWLGLVAAAEAGVTLERLAVVGGRDDSRRQLAAVLAALVDGFDVVLVGADARRRLRSGDTRRLIARVRERGAVLVAMGDDLPGGSAQVRLTATASAWEGVVVGAGHLRRCRVAVEASGRGAASRPRRAEVVLPSRGSFQGPFQGPFANEPPEIRAVEDLQAVGA